ncbi:transcriptional regulator [Roseomonas sp. FDAARGOS_362]|nr:MULTISPECIES: hypothetical protein [Roseomonas]ATR22430.1 transcriptional regulator [Roseomonas sp. FDAARGOS_362]USQ73535.1 transcriptional regulator [Roseomonas mucosa]
MARVALQSGVREATAMAGISLNTIAGLERGEALQPRTLPGIHTALEAAGMEFIPVCDGGAGVRLWKSMDETSHQEN